MVSFLILSGCSSLIHQTLQDSIQGPVEVDFISYDDSIIYYPIWKFAKREVQAFRILAIEPAL
jgi:hypothetical protein